MKRKLCIDTDRDHSEYVSPPPKRFHTGQNTPDRVLTCAHPLANNFSGASQDFGSPDHYGFRSSLSIHPGRSPLANKSPMSASISSSGTPSPHASSSDNGAGLHVLAKPTFLFRPVSDTYLASPSSTSPASSTSSSNNQLQDQLPCNQSPRNTQPCQHERSPLAQQIPVPQPLPADLPQHQRMSSDSDASISRAEDYITDSEMRDHSDSLKSNKDAGFKFKPISPDHD